MPTASVMITLCAFAWKNVCILAESLLNIGIPNMDNLTSALALVMETDGTIILTKV